jgi:hypothetical protein
MIGFDLNSISSPFTDNQNIQDYLIWEYHNNWDESHMQILGIGKLQTPYRGLLLTLPYTGYLANIDSSHITCEIEYSCEGEEFNLTLVNFGDICFENGRKILFSPYDFEINSLNPNPITDGKLNLSFSLGLQVKTHISLIDMQGRVVSILLNSELSSGNYNFIFDVSDLKSGVYYLEFNSELNSKYQKVIIIR